MERFLERVSVSKYKKNFILKGGILISSMVGIDSRMTKDLDLTIKHLSLNENFVKNALIEILSLDIEDETKFTLLDLTKIREDFEYEGFRARIACEFDKTKNTIHIDITTGDIITPIEVERKYNLLLEKRAINITCYPIETILAEKLESILSKGLSTTRAKDFYDCYLLYKLYSQEINYIDLLRAINLTATARKTGYIFENVTSNFQQIQNSENLRALWLAYSNQFEFSKDIAFESTMDAIKELLIKIKLL